MTDAEQSALREDFLAWSGDSPPESEHQITVYLDYAAPSNIDKDQAHHFLRAWMNADES